MSHGAATDLQAGLQQVDGLLADGRSRDALEILRALIRRFPNTPGLLFLGGRTAVSLEELEDACQWLEHLSRGPLPPSEMGGQVIDLLRECGLTETATAYLQRLLKRDPDDPGIRRQEAALTASRGDLEQARSLYQDLLAQDPGCPVSLNFQARDRNEDSAEVLARIERALANTDEPSSLLRFAQGRCLARMGEHQQAFEAVAEGNRLHREQGGEDFGLDRKIEAAPAFVNEFSRDRMDALRDRGHPSQAPVFVVGMPRSGTTLLERIVAAHPAAAGVGERRIMSNVAGGAVRAASLDADLIESLLGTGDGLHRLGDGYLQRIATLLGAVPERVVDKMPFNFALVGVCQLIFPGATVVHARRDPFDICWSMFCSAFDSPRLRFSLAQIGQLFALQEYLMDQWRQRFPDRVVTVDYEQLVESFEPGVRGLIDAVGLPWSSDCLDFHRASGEVRTASDLQVRRPVYATSVGRSAPYRQWMGEFEQALEATRARLQNGG